MQVKLPVKSCNFSFHLKHIPVLLVHHSKWGFYQSNAWLTCGLSKSFIITLSESFSHSLRTPVSKPFLILGVITSCNIADRTYWYSSCCRFISLTNSSMYWVLSLLTISIPCVSTGITSFFSDLFLLWKVNDNHKRFSFFYNIYLCLTHQLWENFEKFNIEVENSQFRISFNFSE